MDSARPHDRDAAPSRYATGCACDAEPRAPRCQRAGGWTDPMDCDPPIRDEYDALADDLYAERD